LGVYVSAKNYQNGMKSEGDMTKRVTFFETQRTMSEHCKYDYISKQSTLATLVAVVPDSNARQMLLELLNLHQRLQSKVND